VKNGRIFSLVLVLASTLPLLALQANWQPKDQGLNLGAAHTSQDWVSLQSSPNVMLAAGKTQAVTLQFQIQQGLHVNSHTPRSAYLIPTTLTLDAPKRLHLSDVAYPQATEYHFPFSPKDSLLVYTGELPITMQAKAKSGAYTVTGKLRYQACDHQACNPPKTLLFTLHVTAK
jgi:hypothetical protein